MPILLVVFLFFHIYVCQFDPLSTHSSINKHTTASNSALLKSHAKHGAKEQDEITDDVTSM